MSHFSEQVMEEVKMNSSAVKIMQENNKASVIKKMFCLIKKHDIALKLRGVFF